MSRNKWYRNSWVAPNSKLYELIEQAEKTKKPEDHKAAEKHSKEVDQQFIKACGLPPDYKFSNFAIGRSSEQDA